MRERKPRQHRRHSSGNGAGCGENIGISGDR
jgi:hypothetical protein